MADETTYEDDCSGFYILYGFPCQIRALDSDSGYVGFMYVPGKGLSPCDVTTIIFEGRPITEEHFKESVIRYSRLRSASNDA